MFYRYRYQTIKIYTITAVEFKSLHNTIKFSTISSGILQTIKVTTTNDLICFNEALISPCRS